MQTTTPQKPPGSILLRDLLDQPPRGAQGNPQGRLVQAEPGDRPGHVGSPRLGGLFQRPGGLEDAYTTAQPLGLDLCRYGQFNLDPIQPGLAARLSEIGRTLHLVGVTIDYAGGSRAFQKTAETVEQVSKDFGTLVDGLPTPR